MKKLCLMMEIVRNKVLHRVQDNLLQRKIVQSKMLLKKIVNKMISSLFVNSCPNNQKKFKKIRKIKYPKKNQLISLPTPKTLKSKTMHTHMLMAYSIKLQTNNYKQLLIRCSHKLRHEVKKVKSILLLNNHFLLKILNWKRHRI